VAAVDGAQISLTMNTYSHLLPSLQEEAAAKMNAILSHGLKLDEQRAGWG